jgi:hypothetical protein
MRLTLRTLLAYLDNALDPQEAVQLRDKLAESGFATQLVQRIRDMLADGSVPAPSPEAVGPVEEANVISEYLDSTLPSEQIAEIERACLESDPHLAEAAACHQILTMVLKKPAEVPAELRERIYELPDRSIEDIAGGGTFSSVNIPMEQPQLNPIADELPTVDLTSLSEYEPVMPVGVADSGVSDAPTRIRQAGVDASNNGSTAAAAGSEVRSAATFYGRSIRPSRIAPWLVSLALAAVLLFALTRIFQPLLDPVSNSNKTVAQADLEDPNAEIEIPPESTIIADAEQPSGAEEASANADDAPPAVPDDLSNSDAPPAPASAELDPGVTEVSEATESQPLEMVATEPDANTPAPVTDVPADDPPAESSPIPPPPTAVAEDAGQPVPPPTADAAGQAADGIAKFTSQDTLFAGLVGDEWIRLKKDMMINAGTEIICAPTFRGQMSISDVNVTVVGPAQVAWLDDADLGVTLHLIFGRILVSATTADAVLNVRLGDEAVQLSFADIESVAGVSVMHIRDSGFDPLKPENRVPLARVLSVQGTIQLTADRSGQTLQTGQQWIKRGSTDAKITPVESVPDWIDAPDPADSTLESGARDGLLELLKGDQPLEIALREATLFRRTEVGALAGQTLLNLGRGDVYFGGDGILNQSKQKLFWPDHFVSLLATVDRSSDSAEQLRKSIVSMDSANAQPLFRLLSGYSQNQLVEGGDEELVQLLDSASMAVRVLALENLRKITGSTSNFRPEKENSANTKWLTRQRKGDIRWQE